jgi:hypothetical protein
MKQPEQKEWKMWQQVYNSLVTDHSDDRKYHKLEYSSEKVENAFFYLNEKADYGIYPAKSRIIAIIYATMLEKVYGEDFYEVLNDPDLLYGQDDFFVPYLEDMDTYDAIIERLKTMPDWLEMGWAPKTVEYFYLECTQKGVESINGNNMTDVK